MKYFDKKIKDKLKDFPEHPLDPRMWEKVSGRLDAIPKGSGLSPLRWAALIALFLLSMVLSFSVGRWSVNDQVVDNVISNNETENIPTGISSIDTLILYDTVVKVVYTPVGQKPSEGTFGKTTAGSTDIRSPRYSHTSIYGGGRVYRENQLGSPTHDASHENLSLMQLRALLEDEEITLTSTSDHASDARNEQRRSFFADLTRIESPYYVLPDRRRNIALKSPWQLQADDIIRANKLDRFMNYLLPKGHALGLELGTFNLAVDEVEHVSEYVLGLRYEVFFSPSLSITTGIRYRTFSTNYEHELDFNVPEPSGLLPTDRIHEIYSNQRHLAIPVSLKYALDMGGRLWPYVRVGMLWSQRLSGDYKFEVRRGTGDTELTSVLASTNLALNAYLIGIGGEFDIGTSYSAFLDVESRLAIERHDAEVMHGLGIRTGILYRF